MQPIRASILHILGELQIQVCFDRRLTRGSGALVFWSSVTSGKASRRCFKMEDLRSHTTRIARKDKRPGSQEVTVSPLKRIKHSESPACTQPAPPFASSPVRLLKARRMSHHKMTQPSSVGTTPGEEALRTSPSLSLSPRSTRKTVSRLRSDGTLCGHVNISIFTHVQSEVSETT